MKTTAIVIVISLIALSHASMLRLNPKKQQHGLQQSVMVKAAAEASTEAEAEDQSDPRCSNRVAADVCEGLSCKEMDDMITEQEWRTANCGKCDLITTPKALENCNAAFADQC
jgi:hypothetical protein